ncbi:MAG: 4Fe-4S dicluster domain-containing protein [Desulfarculaceae bacterium]|nr:4Fe-4S dicluster domain-containing protein [Desulfarculaceae bacterium]
MLFTWSLHLSLAALLLGLAYKLWSWPRIDIGPACRDIPPLRRLRAGAGGFGRALLSRRGGAMLWALVRDGLFQARSRTHSPLAWIAHLLMFWGMMGLIFLHALGPVLIPDFTATLNPWLFLRDLGGLMLLAGVALVIFRRRKLPLLGRVTRWPDRLALGLLALLVLSGFGLQGLKITSAASYQRMVEEYGLLDEAPDRRALAVYWQEHYGVVFPSGQAAPTPELMARGEELNAESCLDCHARPQWAFASWPLSRALAPLARLGGGALAEQALWHLHYLAAFLALALLPFTKFLHLFTGPLLLMARAGRPRESLSPASLALLRALELDVCTRCGACSAHCSVAPALRHVPNLALLPSEKLAALKALVQRPRPESEAAQATRQGAYICTSCLRCTRLCPVGIDLQDLWLALKEELAALGLGPTTLAVGSQAHAQAEAQRSQEPVVPKANGFQQGLLHSAQADTFRACYCCTTCSVACPVVAQHEEPMKALDLLPHQIMHSLGLGMAQEAMGARMTWHCLTCYRCQEACPMGVRVTDILYELRNLAARDQGQGEAV